MYSETGVIQETDVGHGTDVGHDDSGQPGVRRPMVRLHIWLESGDELFFGAGRAQLLMNVHRLGSLKKAAEDMGMSYRAAWGKIRQSEQVLGVKLIAKRGTRRDGLQLTRFGSMLADMYQKWFDAVEAAALEQAEDIFPFEVRCFDDPAEAEPGD